MGSSSSKVMKSSLASLSRKGSGHTKGDSKGAAAASLRGQPISTPPTVIAKELDVPVSWVDGRRFVSVEGFPYALPQDSTEYTRQTGMHFLIKDFLGRNIVAPVEDVLSEGGHILDVGCSIGTWMIDVATDYPKSKVAGVDMLQEIFPKDITPSNVSFQVANIRCGLPFADNTFDLVHVRLMSTSLLHDEWAGILSECYRVLKVGGYIDLCEMDFRPWMTGPIFSDFALKVNHVFIAKGFDPFVPRRFKTLVNNAGFVDYNHNFKSLPCGRWGKKRGRANQEQIKAFVAATKGLLLSAWEITTDEFDDTAERAFAELDSYRTYFNLHSVYGRKPQPE